MIDDVQIIEAAQRARRIKDAVPGIGVSLDAVFAAIVLGKRRPGRQGQRPRILIPADPPAWFGEALAEMKGRSMTIGEFMLTAGRLPYTRAEALAVGRWFRASGRPPRKCGGRQLFDI